MGLFQKHCLPLPTWRATPREMAPESGKVVPIFMSVLCVCVLNRFSHVWLCNPLDCSPPGSSVHGILQARILEWVAVPSSRGSSQPRNWTQVSWIAGRFFTSWATKGSPRILQWVAYPFSRGSSWPRNRTRSPTLHVDSLPAEPSGKPTNTGAGCPALLQGIFPTQGLNPGFLHYRRILYQLSHQGGPLEAYPPLIPLSPAAWRASVCSAQDWVLEERGLGHPKKRKRSPGSG